MFVRSNTNTNINPHTHGKKGLKVSHRPQTGDSRRVRALIREQAVVIGGPSDWAAGFDPAG